VFVSAHTDYAAQAFDIDAVDYLTKPVRLERLQQALHKTAYRINQSARQPVQATLLIPQREKMLRLPVSEVIYFKAEMKYLTVRAAHHSYLIDGSLSDLQARYPGIFLRVHRNALVAVRAMRALERVAGRSPNEDQWQLHLAGVDEALTISRRQLATVRSAFKTRC
jgi:two-component system response regulator AlgR